MPRHRGPIIALLATAACVALSCAADPGDPANKTNAGAPGSSGSSSGPGGSPGGSSSGLPGGSSSGGLTGSSSGSGGSSGIGPTGSSSGSPAGSSSGSSTGSSGGPVTDSGMEEPAPPTGPIVPEGGASCVSASCPLKVQNEATKASANTIGPDLDIINEGTTALDLASVKVHYYFTADGDTSLAFNCDYAGYSGTNLTGVTAADVTGVFVSMGANSTPYADTYLELSFASGTLPAGVTVSANFRIHDSSFATNYNQANDWSALSTQSATSYVDAPYITAYANGTLAWGIEPGPLAPEAGTPGDGSSGGGVDATVHDAAPAEAGRLVDAGNGG